MGRGLFALTILPCMNTFAWLSYSVRVKVGWGDKSWPHIPVAVDLTILHSTRYLTAYNLQRMTYERTNYERRCN